MKLPTFYIPHGGGPCFFMEERRGPPDMWQNMANFLASIVPSLPERPKAILIVSGHWEEPRFTVHAGAQPELLFDYHGFPPHTYQLRWDAPGAPDVALRARSLLEEAGIPAGQERARGWDHGVFIPMKVAVPDASIPTVQLSLRRDLDPAAHIAAGRALEPLRDEGVLIIGSGMSFHNLRGFGPQATEPSLAFDTALASAATDPDPVARAHRLARWAELPAARFAQPREDHLLPMMVAAGAGGADPGAHVFRDLIWGSVVSAFRWG